jgi:ribose transport system permease protein
MTRIGTWMDSNRWSWSLLGSIIIWIFIGVFSGHFTFQVIIANATLASFLAILGLGQMFAITGGDGGINLSVGFMVTLSAFLSEGIMRGANSNLLVGIMVSLLIALLIGMLCGFIITFFHIPPIVVTLGVGYLVSSASQIFTNGFSAGSPSPLLAHFVKGKILGIPIIILITLLLAVGVELLLRKTVFGKRILSMGQNSRASYLAGVPVYKVRFISFVLSSLFAGFAGILLGAYIGGAFLGMGNPYLLESIGVVVIGGTLISGGKSTAFGTLGGALFLTLLLTLVQLTKLGPGFQDIITGLVIVAVLVLATRGNHAGSSN